MSLAISLAALLATLDCQPRNGKVTCGAAQKQSSDYSVTFASFGIIELIVYCLIMSKLSISNTITAKFPTTNVFGYESLGSSSVKEPKNIFRILMIIFSFIIAALIFAGFDVDIDEGGDTFNLSVACFIYLVCVILALVFLSK